ncbi:hypothetical protein [Thiorhodovibrio winogradskyi]|uniref:hypothetical protein n=1 Tax=Thiorhodovibrio winogradskyi TaxID=77007 RepID=UPI002E2A5131|nr:hypothetical protein [Thiorhodovibrio winogradskyi]
MLNPKDQLHKRAVSISQSLWPTSIVTTDEVLTEFLTYFAERSALLRQAAIQMVARMRVDQAITIAPQGRETFDAGFRLFRARLDKPKSGSWGGAQIR